MRVWVDITIAGDVVFFAPIVRRLEAGGHIVTVTARRFSQADALLRRYGLGAILVGRHKGGGKAARTVGLANRTRQLVGSAATGQYDVATGTHTTDFVLASWTLGLPQMTFPKDEDLRGVTPLSMRLADEVAVPDSVARDVLTAYRPAPRRFVRFPGFKEEYYLHDLHPDSSVLARLGIESKRVVGVVRPARASASASGVARVPGEAALVAHVKALARRRNVTIVLLARDREQRERFLREAPGAVAPETSADGIGLIAAADFFLGEAGSMLREAAALGTPAYTVSHGVLSPVDRALLDAGRLRRAGLPDDVVLEKKQTKTAALEPRDPQIFVDELLELARRRPGRARPGGLARPDRTVR